MADEGPQYPEFRLRLPNGGPETRGRLLTEKRWLLLSEPS